MAFEEIVMEGQAEEMESEEEDLEFGETMSMSSKSSGKSMENLD